MIRSRGGGAPSVVAPTILLPDLLTVTAPTRVLNRVAFVRIKMVPGTQLNEG